MAHTFTFARFGGFDQVTLASGADILALSELDQKLWVALACPSRGSEYDNRTLDLVDTDGDGRIRAPEILAAIEWVRKTIKHPDEVTQRPRSLPLSAVDASTDEGKKVIGSAKAILEKLGKSDASELAISDVDDIAKVFGEMKFNGDGVVPPGSADDADLAKAIEDIVASVGGVVDRGGADGVNLEKVAAFFDAAAAYAAWAATADAADKSVVPLGASTDKALAAYDAVKEKIEDYFTRCRLAGFDTRAAEHLSGAAGDWVGIAAQTLAAADEAVAAFPVAAVTPGQPLPLHAGVNPAWLTKITAFSADAVTPLLGARVALTEADFAELGAKFAPYQAWVTGKAGVEVEGLGADRVRELLASDARERIEALIGLDEAMRSEAEGTDAVERTVRLYCNLHELLCNFVNFRDFYNPDGQAIFQAGTLFLDGRSCNLVMEVTDPGKHAKLAGQSAAFLAYCDCTRPAGAKKTIVAAFMDGDSDFLMVGRNGIYYDRQGADWDATITKVVEQPISIRQAFWSPYKKAAKLIESQIQKLAEAKEKAADANMAKGVTSANAADGKGAEGGKSAGATAFDVGKFAGIMAAVGLALGFILSAVSGLLTGFLALKAWQMPLAIGVLMLLISGPSMLLAWLKLRQRNLAPLLDASGWAINARARINVPFGASLTGVATLPDGCKRQLEDPFAEKKTPWGLYIFGLVVLGVGVWMAIAWSYNSWPF